MLCVTVDNGGHIKIGEAMVYLSIRGGKIKVGIDADSVKVPVEREGVRREVPVRESESLTQGG